MGITVVGTSGHAEGTFGDTASTTGDEQVTIFTAPSTADKLTVVHYSLLVVAPSSAGLASVSAPGLGNTTSIFATAGTADYAGAGGSIYISRVAVTSGGSGKTILGPSEVFKITVLGDTKDTSLKWSVDFDHVTLGTS